MRARRTRSEFSANTFVQTQAGHDENTWPTPPWMRRPSEFA